MTFDWINTNGGPLICCNLSASLVWQGASGRSINSSDTDYDLACASHEYLNVIRGGVGDVLVLGDEPLQSSFHKTPEGLLVIRWISCASPEYANEYISSLPSSCTVIEDAVDYDQTEINLIMMDAALNRTSDIPIRQLELKIGHYRVTTELYKQDGIFEFLIHRFHRMEKSESDSN